MMMRLLATLLAVEASYAPGQPAPMAMRLVALLGVAQASYPGPHRGYRGMPETERIEFYEKNGYRWPPTKATQGWPPVARKESAAYKKSRDEMEAWIRRNLTTYKATWDEWSSMVQSRAMPAFTAQGFQVVDYSDTDFYRELKALYDKNVRDPVAFSQLRKEKMQGTGNARFYSQSQLNAKLLDGLRPSLEKWSGIELQNGQSYGVRVYGEGSTLVNHIDRCETHVISAIFHIDHDLDEPWPLEIEDHDGNWHEVKLCVEINQCVRCTGNSSLSHFAAMTRPCWLRRAVRNRHRHVIEQASCRWRGGQRDDLARTRRKILIFTQVNLKPGEVCYYESAKQYHARLQPMRGRAYASVFLHWFPAQDWNWTMWDGHVMVPPDFEAPEASGFFRKRVVNNAGPPPFLRNFDNYWRKMGRPSPSLPRGVENPVQEYEGFGAPSPTPEETQRLRLVNAAAARTHAQRGDVAELHALLDRVSTDFLDDGDENGWTALHEAARSGHADVLRLLVNKGADASKRTKYGQSAHDIARDVHHEDHPAMRFLGEL